MQAFIFGYELKSTVVITMDDDSLREAIRQAKVRGHAVPLDSIGFLTT